MSKNKAAKSEFSPSNAKQARFLGNPKSDKNPVLGADPTSCLKLKPSWKFNNLDLEHPEWGWNKLSSDDFIKILSEYLFHLETMSWDDILKASGGRSNGNNHHNIEVSKICSGAQSRLKELNIDVDQLFSLRLNGTWRLWGIKEGQILRFLWSDKYHAICPSKQ